jgi:cell division protein ZapA
MSNQNDQTSVQIAGKNYHVKCQAEQISELKEAVDYLNKKFQSMEKGGYSLGTEKGAVMLALNVTHELISIKKQQGSQIDTMSQRIQDLKLKIEATLSDNV